MKVSELFTVSYGTNLELNHLEKTKNGINFVSRTSKNNGVSAIVEPMSNIEPLDAGLITVAAGGSVMSSFVQIKPFYSGRDIFYLEPINEMTIQEKLFYCMCLRANKYKFSYGRQANQTIKDLELPDKIPDWVHSAPILLDDKLSNCVCKTDISLTDRKWLLFQYDELFCIEKGKRIVNDEMEDGVVPCIRPREFNNGVFKFIDIVPNHDKNTITVSYNGSVGEAFYQPRAYFALDDINVLYPKFQLNAYVAMFLITLIRLEKHRYNFGYKWHKERMKQSVIKLPVNDKKEPDWEFMENYIKSLPYSSNLETKVISS